MLSIGQFSKICSVSVKALRHYDSIGLLRPQRVDPFTGYRYYSDDQIDNMLLINRLKRYGFSLAEISCIINSPQDYFVQCLKNRISRINIEIEAAAAIAAEMQEIVSKYERIGDVMSYTEDYNIILKNTQDIPIISSRQRMSVDEFGRYYGRLFERIARGGILSSGKAMAVYHDSEFDENDSDIEVGIEVKNTADADRIISGGLCAHTVHIGSYARLAEAYGAVVKYINANGYKITAPPYEFYRISHTDGQPPEKWETDIYFPIEKQ